jgi:enoyl-CoA hydratase
VYEPLDVEVRQVTAGVVRIVTLHRPTARNAMDTRMLAALVDTLEDAAADTSLRGLLVTGGPEVFSAGADVREELPDGGRRRMELFTEVYERLTLFPVPTVAAVEGYAVGGGAEVAAACDMRVAGRSAVFRFPGVVHGIPIGVARTVGQVGLSVAKDWVLSGRDVDVHELDARGFVQQVVDDTATTETALGWLDGVAGRDPDTVALLKRMFNEQSGLRDRVAFENDTLRSQAETGHLPDLGADLPRTVRPRRR